MPSIDKCVNNLEYSVGDFNRTYMFLVYDHNYLWFDYTFNVTQLISTTIADSSRDCTMASLQAFNQTMTRVLKFASITDWILGFLQNMLGNVVAFQKIYDKINTSLAANNVADVCFQVGRILNLLLDFKPLEKEAYEETRILFEGYTGISLSVY